MVDTWNNAARSAFVVACIAGFTPTDVNAVPAFARKYGMRCSACHLAEPVLNAYGEAFKDRGYRMEEGTDDLRANEPAYWPVFAWLAKNYQLEADRVGGVTVKEAGGIANGALVFGGLGSISDHLSFRFVPVIYEDGVTIVDHGWIRYNQAFGTDWVNLKLGSSELELPFSAGRDYNLGSARFATMYVYSVPGSVSRFSMLIEPGFEIMGHDRGSRTRYSVNVFTAGGAPQTHCAVCAPGVFGRVTHRQELADGFVRSVQLGAFGTYATWPVGPDTTDLKAQRRLGGDLELVLGSDVLPLRVTAIGMTGRDDRELVPLATNDPTFNAGLLELAYVPKLSLLFYGRFQIIRNQQQAVAARSDGFGDQDFQMVGMHYNPELTSRFGWWLDLSYGRQRIVQGAPAGQDLTRHLVWIGTHLAF
jgi:hypothetical protein